MSLIAWLLETTGSFDKLRQGRYDEGSACGASKECEDVKKCIFNICSPNNAFFGGQFYDDCINYCNAHPDMEDVSEMLCENPQAAYELYGYDCKGYTPKTKSGYINIFGKEVSLIMIGSVIIFFFILYVIYQRV